MDIEYIKEKYLNGSSAYQIAKELDVATHKIYYVLNKYNIKCRSNKENSRKYVIDHEFFDKIDNEVKAYWLGFISADGYVTSTNGKKFGVVQKVPEHTHLTVLSSDMKSTYPVNVYKTVTSYGGTEYGRFLVSSDKLYDSLVIHGVTEKKSLTLSPPKINQSLNKHFIRGYFDGDGSASLGSNNPRIRFCGTEEMLAWIEETLGVSKTIWSKRYDDNKNNHQISIQRIKDLQLTSTFMYKDATRYLERKYSRLQKFIQSS